ncbi:MAG: hypothetical protein ACI9SP_000738 [Arenicella sp.]|jgi:hypothetical protein
MRRYKSNDELTDGVLSKVAKLTGTEREKMDNLIGAFTVAAAVLLKDQSDLERRNMLQSHPELKEMNYEHYLKRFCQDYYR